MRTLAIIILKIFLPAIALATVLLVTTSFAAEPGDDAGVEVQQTGQHVNVFVNAPESVNPSEVFVRFQQPDGQYIGKPVAATENRVNDRVHLYFKKRSGMIAVLFVGNKPVYRLQ